jgi:hypothetical protein
LVDRSCHDLSPVDFWFKWEMFRPGSWQKPKRARPLSALQMRECAKGFQRLENRIPCEPSSSSIAPWRQ